jgi:hypothetical protein
MTETETLIALERTINAGTIAMRERNRLIVDMVNNGHRQSDIMRTVNAVRQEMGEPPVTLGAIHIVMRRAKEAAA